MTAIKIIEAIKIYPKCRAAAGPAAGGRRLVSFIYCVYACGLFHILFCIFFWYTFVPMPRVKASKGKKTFENACTRGIKWGKAPGRDSCTTINTKLLGSEQVGPRPAKPAGGGATASGAPDVLARVRASAAASIAADSAAIASCNASTVPSCNASGRASPIQVSPSHCPRLAHPGHPERLPAALCSDESALRP